MSCTALVPVRAFYRWQDPKLPRLGSWRPRQRPALNIGSICIEHLFWIAVRRDPGLYLSYIVSRFPT